MSYSYHHKPNQEKHVGALPLALWARVWSACTALLILLGAMAMAHATPPPQAIEEGFGVPSAVAQDATPTVPSKPEVELTTAQKIEALLAETPDELDYGTAERCLTRHQVKRYEVLDSSLLLVHGRRGKAWINQLSHKCVGLRRNMPLVLRVHGSQVCALDSFYGRESWERFDSISSRGLNLGSVHCVFAKFEAVTAEQAKMLKQAAKNGVFR